MTTPRHAGALMVLVLLGCGPAEEDRAAAAVEALETARADSMARAEALYDPAGFDSISWVSPDTALARGSVVWRYSCQDCHGPNGAGGGDVAVRHELNMPNLRAEDWEYAGDRNAIRHRVFVGHMSEMPNWGLHGLSYRDIDAVTGHILTEIRQ